jgi:hypothetical protein
MSDWVPEFNERVRAETDHGCKVYGWFRHLATNGHGAEKYAVVYCEHEHRHRDVLRSSLQPFPGAEETSTETIPCHVCDHPTSGHEDATREQWLAHHEFHYEDAREHNADKTSADYHAIRRVEERFGPCPQVEPAQ